jgi:hypothetical protein
MTKPIFTRTNSLVFSSWIALGLLLSGCPTEDNTLGSQGCEQGGKTYQVGQTMVLSGCTTCVCQKDGVIGMCTGLCDPDGSVMPQVMCAYDNRMYPIGAPITTGACTRCVCQKDGTIGACTDTCPPDAALPDLPANPGVGDDAAVAPGPADGPANPNPGSDASTLPVAEDGPTNPNPGSDARPAGADSALADPCNPTPASGTHLVHFRYLWAGQKTFTMFPKPERMPKTLELQLAAGTKTATVTCNREQDRPWFACLVPDAYFAESGTWLASDKTHSPAWTTTAPRTLPGTPGEYWLRWSYGRPDVVRSNAPATFEVLDYYPDAAYGDWSAGAWSDSTCASKAPSTPPTVGFGGWFPFKGTQHKYPYGASLAYAYPADGQGKLQDALDAFVFERYNLWKKNWIKVDDEACGPGTARVLSDIPAGTVSEGQGYGMAMAAAVGDKDLFGKLWTFVRHFRSSAKYGGLMGWIWNDKSDCQATDAFGTDDSAFDGDADIGIGLVYAAMQWPEYTDAATDWLVRMEGEVNTSYGDGYNYPTPGDSWDKTLCSATTCTFAPKTESTVYVDYLPPGYFRVFGDFLASKLGTGAQAANGQSHHDFWYKTAETVWELVERCYDVKDVHPGLMGNSARITAACSAGGGEPYEWGRALWRLAIDAAWFGNKTDLPENKAGSSRHYGPKSRVQAKMDNIQDFYSNFYKHNPTEANANRFSTLCHQLGTDGAVTNCDPAYGHNGYTVNVAMGPYVTFFDDGGALTNDVRREALEEAVSTTLLDDRYFQESLGVYALLFLTGNFPNPLTAQTP